MMQQSRVISFFMRQAVEYFHIRRSCKVQLGFFYFWTYFTLWGIIKKKC